MRYEFTSQETCDMCGSASRRTLGLRLNQSTGVRPRRAAGIAVPVKRCNDCGLIYSDPRPLPMAIADHYEMGAEEYFGQVGTKVEPFDNSRLVGLMEIHAGLKVLDVGAGVGHNMLSFEGAGWEAWGVEPSESFIRYGTENLGLRSDRLLCQSFEDTDLPDNSFDMVWFASVLEHLPSPTAALKVACRILKPGGLIHIGVPSSRSIVSRLLNAYYRISGTQYVTNISPMHPPFHLYEFSHRCFEDNGKQLGYEVARHEYQVQPGMERIPRLLQPLVRSTLNRIGLGDGLLIYLRKL